MFAHPVSLNYNKLRIPWNCEYSHYLWSVSVSQLVHDMFEDTEIVVMCVIGVTGGFEREDGIKSGISSDHLLLIVMV